MMELNITLLIQAVHFFVAAWFLHRYIFVPAYAIIHKEDRAIHQIESKINTLQVAMTEQRSQNQIDWKKIQKRAVSSIDQEKKEVSRHVNLDDVILEDGVCELNDDEVVNGTTFLQDTVTQVSKGKK